MDEITDLPVEIKEILWDNFWKMRDRFEKEKEDKTMNTPKNQTAEVLHALLTNKAITRRTLPVLNLTARLADLRNLGLEIPCFMIEYKNKFGRSASYGTWSLADGERELAEQIYKTINHEEIETTGTDA